jgi:hypothetical protein
MSTNAFDDILNRARKELTPDEQQKLINELADITSSPNGGKVGRTLYDALKDRGLIGFMSDGPDDLSTNPKHMEGFGKDAV